MKKIINFFALLSLIICELFVFLGCNNNFISTYIIANFDEIDVGEDVEIVQDKLELKYLLNGQQAPEKYDDLFFYEKCLLMIKFINSGQNKVKSYNMNNNIITINLESITCDNNFSIGDFWCVLELYNDDLIDIDSVIVINDNKEIKNIRNINKINEIKYIKEVVVDDYNTNGYNNLTINDIEILYYLGKYEDAYCAITKYDSPIIFPIEETYKVSIDNEEFMFKYIPEYITVYLNDKRYNLITACELGIMNKEDVEKLHSYCEKNIF